MNKTPHRVEELSFDDVLIQPEFSFIKSRKDVSLEQHLMGYRLGLPIISSNMDTITGHTMANAMAKADAVGALHRFCTIEENVEMFKKGSIGGRLPFVSIGLGNAELERAEALFAAGATQFIIDVAHGASMETVRQFRELNELGRDVEVMVGNFATGRSIKDFEYHAVRSGEGPMAYKVGIGGGSMCTTRIVTGCGMPTFASVVDCASTGRPIVADGGMRNSGDIAKALAAGASAVMLGSLFAGTDECPSEDVPGRELRTIPVHLMNIAKLGPNEMTLFTPEFLKDTRNFPEFGEIIIYEKQRKYRGSASKDSYEVQGKTATHRAPEGESTIVPYKGPVQGVLDTLSAGIRSAMSYVGAQNLGEFREKAQFIRVTGAGSTESKAHGKK